MARATYMEDWDADPDMACRACGGEGREFTGFAYNEKTHSHERLYGDKKCPVCKGHGWRITIR